MEPLRLLLSLVVTAAISFYDYAPGKKKNFVNDEEKKSVHSL